MSKKHCYRFAYVYYLYIPAGYKAQTIDVSGIVVYAEDNEPVIGANVQVKGTQQGAITDIDGKFIFKGLPLSSKLIISYVGLKSQK